MIDFDNLRRYTPASVSKYLQNIQDVHIAKCHLQLLMDEATARAVRGDHPDMQELTDKLQMQRAIIDSPPPVLIPKNRPTI